MIGKIVAAFVAVTVALAVGQDFETIRELRASFTAEVQLGIDLGTTQSVAAVCVQGNVSVVKVDGSYTTPSTVWFSSSRGNHEVGEKAVAKRSVDPKNVLYATKRVMGVSMRDVDRSEKLSGLPFEFDSVNNGRDVGFRLSNKREAISPEQVGSLIVRKLKEASEQSHYIDSLKRMMGFSFKSLTVSIPVTFGEQQKVATIKACQMAGFRQVRLIEEPVAAAMAYGLGKEKATNRVLVFDIGGGTLDVALLYFNAHAGTFYVENTAGEAQLGGEDFDIIAANVVLSKLKDKKMSNSIHSSEGAWQRLLVASERAKRELSREDKARVCVPSLNENESCIKQITITREEFERAAKDKFDLSLKSIQQVLDDAKLDRNVDLDVVLVGGTSRIPAIRTKIAEFLPNSTLHFDSVDPDQAVAVGAAKSWGCNH